MQVGNCRRLCLVLLPSLALLAAGCGGGGGGGGPKPEPINNPPSVSIVQPDRNPCSLDVQSAQYLDITVQVNDPDGGKVDCIWTWDAGSVSPSEQSVDAGGQTTARFTPPSYDGQCNLTVTVSDGEASVAANIAVQVTGSIGTPTGQLRIASINANPDPVLPSQASTLSANVENPSGKTLTYNWKCRYGTLTGSGRIVTWTAPGSTGAYGIYLTISDGTKSVSGGRVVTVAGPAGGLLGEYFKTIRDKNIVKLDQMVFTRLDPQINFLWERLSPDPSKLPSEGWGARWTGYVKCEQPGSYVFRAHVDDGIRVKVQNDNGDWVAVIPTNDTNWTDHTGGAWLPEYPEAIQLQGGKWYPIEVEFFQGAADAFIRLYWSINGGQESIIPQDALKPPST